MTLNKTENQERIESKASGKKRKKYSSENVRREAMLIDEAQFATNDTTGILQSLEKATNKMGLVINLQGKTTFMAEKYLRISGDFKLRVKDGRIYKLK